MIAARRSGARNGRAIGSITIARISPGIRYRVLVKKPVGEPSWPAAVSGVKT